MQITSRANLWSSERFYEGELGFSQDIFKRSIFGVVPYYFSKFNLINGMCSRP